MSTEKFRDINFRPAARAKIAQMESIVDEYQQQGFRLTARQLYYQFVSRDLISNLPAEYKKLTALLTDARYAGLIDWDAVEDRGRVASSPSEFESIADLTRVALRAYRLPRWEGQTSYAELWVEKQALAGVLSPLASQFHVTLMVNKGYSSASAMKESAVRIQSGQGPEMKTAIIFYLGDHDPSGEDMVRDIEERLAEFGVLDLAVVKIALTTHQVKQYKPPPNPAKLTDPRAAAYISKHGNKSWEVDALPPNVLAKLIKDSFEDILDIKKMDAIKVREESDKKRLLVAVGKIK
jgi:hypothetical protein